MQEPHGGYPEGQRFGRRSRIRLQLAFGARHFRVVTQRAANAATSSIFQRCQRDIHVRSSSYAHWHIGVLGHGIGQVVAFAPASVQISTERTPTLSRKTRKSCRYLRKTVSRQLSVCDRTHSREGARHVLVCPARSHRAVDACAEPDAWAQLATWRIYAIRQLVRHKTFRAAPLHANSG